MLTITTPCFCVKIYVYLFAHINKHVLYIQAETQDLSILMTHILPQDNNIKQMLR